MILCFLGVTEKFSDDIIYSKDASEQPGRRGSISEHAQPGSRQGSGKSPTKPGRVKSSNLAEQQGGVSGGGGRKSPNNADSSRQPAKGHHHHHHHHNQLPHQIAAEEALVDREKEGTILKINMSSIFGRQASGSASIKSPLDELKMLKVTLSAGESLPRHFIRELKPLTLTVEKVSQLPTSPVSHEELSKR